MAENSSKIEEISDFCTEISIGNCNNELATDCIEQRASDTDIDNGIDFNIDDKDIDIDDAISNQGEGESDEAKSKKDKFKRSFLSGAVILAVASLFAKLLGAIYRIPLTNIIGVEGIGLYQLAFPIYSLMITLSGASIPTAIARLVSERRTLHDSEGLAKVGKSSLVILIVGGLIMSIILVLMALPISKAQGNSNIAYCYYILAPAIVIVAISGFYKGWFQGNMNMVPTSVMQFVEQGVKLVLGLTLAVILIKKSVVTAVIGAFVAVSVSELFGLLTLFVMYKRKYPKIRVLKQKSDKNITKIVLKTSIPIMLSGSIMAVVQFIDSIIIVKLLTLRGNSQSIATGQYGMLTGVANTLVNMPVVLTLALAIAIVPTVAMYKSKRDAVSIKEKASMSIKIAYLIGMPCFMIFAILSERIVAMLYPTLSAIDQGMGAMLLRVSSLQVIIYSTLQIYNSLLQGLGYQNKALINMGICGLLKVLLEILLIYYYGIIGGVISAMLAFGLASVLNYLHFRKILGKNVILFKSISKILAVSVIMGVVYVLSLLINNIYASLVVAILVGGAVYLAGTFVFKVFTAEEMGMLPFCGKLTKILYKNEDKR